MVALSILIVELWAMTLPVSTMRRGDLGMTTSQHMIIPRATRNITPNKLLPRTLMSLVRFVIPCVVVVVVLLIVLLQTNLYFFWGLIFVLSLYKVKGY